MKMKTILIIIVILVLVLVGTWLLLQKNVIEEGSDPELSGGDSGTISEKDLYGKEASKKIAQNWILENSSTYKFDGINLKFKEIRESNCNFCYVIVFEFESRYAGYGDRTDEVLAQVITPHTIIIYIEKGLVKRAEIDNIYDEINNKLLKSSSSGDEEVQQLANPASVYCVGQGGTLEIRTDSQGGQYGVCVFSDGSECEEWDYFNGECLPGENL